MVNTTDETPRLPSFLLTLSRSLCKDAPTFEILISGACTMKRTFTASIDHEGDWYIAQCLEVDLASQGETEQEALLNMREAIALHFTPPVATAFPNLRLIEVEIGAA